MNTVETTLWPLCRSPEELVEQVAPVGPPLAVVPEVMMRIADRQCRIDGLFPDLSQPGVVRCHASISSPAD